MSTEDRPAPSSGSFSDSALEPAANEAMKAEDWSRAETLFAELSRRQPRNPPAGKSGGLGVALMRQDKNEKAIEALQGSPEIADDAQTRSELAHGLPGVLAAIRRRFRTCARR